MIQSLLGGLAVAWMLLLPVVATAQPNADRVMEPTPQQRSIRARPPQPQPRQAPTAAPVIPAAPFDRSAGGESGASVTEEGLVNLDFEDVELAVVIDTIAKLTNRNFVYDDRVRGRVTIVSPTPVPVEQAYTVFESMLQVKGFTTVEAPGGVIKVIPIRDAKETSVDTGRTRDGRTTPNTDRFVTRLIPLSYIDAEQISNTLKPLVSKEAALVAYQPTNTIILTDSASNIRRILSILEAIDVETFRQELALIRLQFADATVVADQLSELFGVEVVGAARGQSPAAAARARARPQPVIPGQPGVTTSPEAAQRGQVRIITDERTNSLLALASRSTLEEIRDFIRRIDVPVEGGGRIQVYYLKYADAEELADTLNSLLSGALPASGGGGPGVQAQPQLAGAVGDIASGVGTVTADIATNSLLIQASPEGYQALLRVIEQLDIARPQVLVEALIMEVTVGDGEELGFNIVGRILDDPDFSAASRTDSPANSLLNTGQADDDDGDGSSIGDLASSIVPLLAGPQGFLARIVVRNNGEDIIRAALRAAATDNSFNVLSAPHILTSDNEEAEILVGDNIPIITSRVQSAGTVVVDEQNNLATSVNVERQDIGVTLRVTPQITEGETMRLDIFQEITAINSALQSGVGDPNQVGPALSNRRIENSVVVKDGETVVIGGLISDDFTDRVTKVPWLGDIPVLGWLFKSTQKTLAKRNLLVFLTPRVIRSADDLVKQSIVKREEFRRRSEQALGDQRIATDELDEPVGILGDPDSDLSKNPAASAVGALERRYPLERMLEIERTQASQRAKARAAAAAQVVPKRYLVLGGVFADPGVAQSTLTRLVDAGFEGTLVSSRASGRVLLELRVGPYRDLEAAERAAEALRRGYALAPQVLVQRPEGETP